MWAKQRSNKASTACAAADTWFFTDNRAVRFHRLSQQDSPANRCFSHDRCCLTTLLTGNPYSHEQERCWTGLRLERCGCVSGVLIHFLLHHRPTETWSLALLWAKYFC